MAASQVLLFRVPTQVFYGPGVSGQVGEKVQALGAKRVLVVTDKGVISAGLLDGITSSLKEAGIEYGIFSGVDPNPAIANVDQCVAALRESGAEAVIGVGGGSPLDVAKATSILATNGGRISDYEGAEKVRQPTLPLLAIPTTAGTGSEVTIFTVITDPDRRAKFTIASVRSAARMALVDPLLTMSMPPRLTAAVGMDVLTHAVESIISVMSWAPSQALALESIRLVSANLVEAVEKGDSFEARDGMMKASLLGGMCFNNTRLGPAHAMAHPVGGFFNAPHGVVNAILLPHVMEYSREYAVGKLAAIAQAMGVDTSQMSAEEASRAAVDAVRALGARIGIPKGLAAIGVDATAIPAMARDAMTSGNIAVTPRPTQLADIIRLYEEAM